jgi:hypothetical protein
MSEICSKMYIGPHVKYPLFFPIFMKFEFSRLIFEKSSNVKFHENPSIESRAFSCGQTDGRTYMTKLMVAIRNFANAPKIFAKFRTTWQLTIFIAKYNLRRPRA